MSLRAKIILAFGALFVVAFGLMWAVATRLVSEAVENQLAAQASNAATLFSHWASPLQPTFVANSIRRVYGAEAAVLDDTGRWGGTLDAASQAALEAARSGMNGALDAPRRVAPWRLADGRETFAVFVPYRAHEVNVLDGKPPAQEGALYLFYPAEQVTAEIARARRPLLAVGIGALALVAILGVWIARTVTRPIERLAARTREVAEGHLTPQSKVQSPKSRVQGPPAHDAAREGVRTPDTLGPRTGDGGRGAGDEVGQLAAAFDRMVEDLRRSQENLVRSEKLAVAGQIAAGIAHEIRNPLTAMRMTVQLLAREERDAERRRSLDLLLAEIGRLEAAVNELMDLAGPAQHRREPIDVNALVDEVLTLVQPQVAHQGVDVRRESAPLPSVTADPSRLRRVVMNLVLNAIQAMPDRGRLTVRTRAVSEVRGPGSKVEGEPPAAGARQWTLDVGQIPAVRLEVSDTGPGIPPGIRDRVFEPFVSSKPGGNGLGLSTTKRIVEEHGGRMGFETGPAGTTFWIELDALPQRREFEK